MKKRNLAKFVVLLGFVLFTSLFYSFYNKDFEIVKNLDIYYTLFRELNLFYVDDTDPEKLVKTSIDEMLKSLDPYTSYIPESKMKDFKFMTTGKYGGIGALIRKRGDYTIISDPYKGFPADKAGLRAGDTLITIDGKSAKNLDLSQVSNLLKGTPNNPVDVQIKRFGVDKTLNIKVIREEISINDVPYYGMLNNHAGYIKLNNFTKGASDEVQSALKELKSQNDSLSGVILDLRSNPGGILVEAVEIANIFVNKGKTIVSTRGKVKRWDHDYKTSKNPLDTDIKLVVLINRGSASASEIVAGAMQDLDRGVLIGSRTFGKGLVQTTRPLSYNAKLKVTTAKYYIPSGRCIQALDYSSRNEDGSVGKIPDSLITEFSTVNGRKVYDGGGINPDIKINNERNSAITLSLFKENVIFDFATMYYYQNDSIPKVESFDINDDTYYQFIDFVTKQEFDYKTATEKKLDELISIAKKEKYFQIAKEEFDSLGYALGHDIQKDLLVFRKEISRFIENEIINRYYYQSGQVQHAIEFDVQVEKAIELLETERKYDSILAVTYTNDSTIIKD